MVATTESLRQHYPFASHYTQVNRQKMHYLDEGQGEVILALHGNPTWSFYYRNVIKQLRSEYRLVVPDHIGCGFSDKPDESNYSYCLEQRVKDIEALVRTLRLKNITLMLHDWGGMIGLAFAARNPDLIRRVVLMNSAGFPLPGSKNFPWRLALSRIPLLSPLLNRGLNSFVVGASWIGAQRDRLPRDLRQLYRLPYGSWQDRVAIHRFVQDIPLSPKHPSWPLVQFTSQNLERFRQIPFQIIWGEKDFVFDKHFLAEWRQRLPEAEYYSYADAGHYILDDLGDEAVELIRSFLQRHPL